MRRWIALLVVAGSFHLTRAGAAEQGGGAKDLVPENLARGKPATASTSQDADRRPGAAVDGDPETRWCPEDDHVGHWWQVDLGKPQNLTGCRIAWELDGVPYRYKVEGSADGKAWKPLTDQSASTDTHQERTHRFDAKGIRHVRLTGTGLQPGAWSSFYEFEALGTKLVERPKRSGNGLAGVKVPAGFEATLFAAPPDVRYPTCLAAAPTGEVFVGIDENGSIDAKPDRGRVVRCRDDDGDGKADRFNVFARMDSPRGVIYDAGAGTLYVLHPPDLTAFRDADGDGVAESRETLVKGIGFSLKFRGADHTTNGIRLGIDGWIYVAVGDYGFIRAEGKDGATLPMRGGGIVRVRPDGTGLESVSRGQRNIYDVAIDPFLNLFTRDNTNDGGGWDVRLSHVIPTGQYGYPSLFKNFADEILPPLADYGGGSPTGSLYLQEPGFPAGYGDALYTCEWGRSFVYRHPLEPRGASFKAGQEPFVEIQRPTDMDVDGQSRLYISTWRGGGFTFDKPDVGNVVRVTPTGTSRPKFPDLKAATDAQLLEHLSAPSQVLRGNAQRELLRRGPKPATAEGLEALARAKGPLAGRVAAILTLEQLLGMRSYEALFRLAKDATIREFALRALADRKEAAAVVPVGPFEAGLADPNPRVRLQAAIGLGRLGKGEVAAQLLPGTADPDPLVAHAAIQALAALRAVDACLTAIDPATPTLVPGAIFALQLQHDPRAVDGLIRKLHEDRAEAARRAVLKALCRLYHKEADYTGDWWGTQPDTSGPYYKGVAWDRTEAIGRALREALKSADPETTRWLLIELVKDKIDFEESSAMALKLAGRDPAFRAATVDLLLGRKSLPADAVAFLDGVAASDREAPALRAKVLRGLKRHWGQHEARDAILHGYAAINRQDEPPAELLAAWREFARDGGHAREVGDFRKLAEGTDEARGELGYAVLVGLDDNPRLPQGARDEARKGIEAAWRKPSAAARLLRAIGLAESESYALQARAHLKDGHSEVRRAAAFASRALDLDGMTGGAAARGEPVAGLPYERVVAGVQAEKGDAKLGTRLFQRQGCIACHTTSPAEPPKGPYLGGIATRYSRAELTESILKPNAKIAQGFEPQRFALADGLIYEGFVTRESGDEVELRNAAGVVTVLPKKEIEERAKGDVTIMPAGLVDTLSVRDLASLLAYLESLKTK